jgi:hypothetical protein
MTHLEQMLENGAVLAVESVEGSPGLISFSLDATTYRTVIHLDDEQAEEAGKALIDAARHARSGI